jgi:hypothetical protein
LFLSSLFDIDSSSQGGVSLKKAARAERPRPAADPLNLGAMLGDIFKKGASLEVLQTRSLQDETTTFASPRTRTYFLISSYMHVQPTLA